MGTAPIPRSLAVAGLLRASRKALGFTLREVTERLAAKGEPLPASTLARIESGRLDPGVRRLHLLLDLYRIPAHLVTDLVEMEALAAKPPVETNLEMLFEEGRKAWKRGNIPQGLAYLFALRQNVPPDAASRILRQKACLGMASFARDLGKNRVARQVVEDLLCEPPDPSLIVRVLVLASSLWRDAGSLEVALALVRQAETRLEGDGNERAITLHQKAKLLLEANDLEQAQGVLTEAIGLFRGLGDLYGETRALMLQASLLERKGELDLALGCARKIIASAEGTHVRVEMMGRLELGRLLVASGSVEEGLAALRHALGQAVMLEDHLGQFNAHHRLWKAYEKLRDPERAALERQAACYFVRFTDDHSPETEEVRELAKVEGTPWSAARVSES